MPPEPNGTDASPNTNRYGDLFGLSKATSIGQAPLQVAGRPLAPPAALAASAFVPDTSEATALEEMAIQYGKDTGLNLLAYIGGKLREMAQQQGYLPTRSQLVEKLRRRLSGASSKTATDNLRGLMSEAPKE